MTVYDEDPQQWMANQAQALDAVAQLVLGRGANAVTTWDMADVATLAAHHEPSATRGPHEVVCATSGYDLWRDGKLVGMALSAEVAAHHVVDDYRQAKAGFVADRLIREHKSPPGMPRAKVVRMVMGMLTETDNR